MFPRTLAVAALLWMSVIPPAWAATPCPSLPPRNERGNLEVGLGMVNLLPSGLSDFQFPILGYGPRIAYNLPTMIAFFYPAFYAEMLYGTDDAFTLWLNEAGLRLAFSIPFFDGFFVVGGHRLSYSHEGRQYGYWGSHFGGGLLAAMGPDLELTVSMKGYMQGKPMLAFAFGFSYLL